jgi:predicted Zn-dependent protease
VVALSPEEDAIMQLTLAQGDSPEAAAGAFFEQQGVVGGERWTSGYRPDVARSFAVDNEGGQRVIDGWVTYTAQSSQIFQLLGYAKAEVSAQRGSALRPALASLRPLQDRRWLDVQPMRIEVAAARATEAVEQAQVLRSSVPAEEILLINRLNPGQTLARGTLVKSVVGEDPRLAP